MRKIFLFFIVASISAISYSQDTITIRDVQSAAKLLDLSFTPKELDTMYDGVKENLMGYRMMHKQQLNNNVPMSLWQSPVLPGMHFNEKQETINWNIPTNVKMPENKNELAFYSIQQLASLIKNKKISSVDSHSFLLTG